MHPTISPLAGAPRMLCNIYAICHSCVSSRLHTPPYAAGVHFSFAQFGASFCCTERATLCFFVALRTRLADCKKRERERKRTPTRAQGCRRLSFWRHRKGAARSRDILKSTHAASTAQRNHNNRWRDAGAENALAIKIRI